MMLRAYTVYDNKALQFHAPFFAATDGAALRSFDDLSNDPNTTVGRHPSDYSLYRIGEYDDSKGSLLPIQPIVHVADAAQLVQIQPRLPIDNPLSQPLQKTSQPKSTSK